ncbi:MAG: AtpZ/AtpI family protein [bacterium]
MKNNGQNNELWWKPAIIVFASVSAWIAVPIIVALYLGKYLDKKYASQPKFFLILIAVAFLITIFGIIRILKKQIGKMKDNIKS